MTSTQQLRERLQQITNESVESHPGLIAELRTESPHSIELVSDVSSLPISTCFEYSLDLVECLEVHKIAEVFLSTFCNSDFVQHLVDSILVLSASPSNGDLVLYRNEQEFKHAGVFADSRVISKWGEGHVWVHGRYEVPTSYGDEISFYRKPYRSIVVATFIQFARHREGKELVDLILEGKYY